MLRASEKGFREDGAIKGLTLCFGWRAERKQMLTNANQFKTISKDLFFKPTVAP